jgi:hypothetical protein
MGNVARTRIYAWPAFRTDRRGTDQRLRPFKFVRHVVFLDLSVVLKDPAGS